MSEKQSNSLKIITIIAMMFLYAMISFVTNLAAPVGKIWGASFDDPAQAERMGMLGNLFNFLAYLIMGIPAGNFLSKHGYKKTALTAIFLGFIGIAIQWFSGAVDSFYVYLAGALVCGFCVCMLNTVVNPMLNLLGGGGNRGNQLNMIGGTLNSLSGALTPMLVGAIIGESLAGKQIDDVNIVLYIAMSVFAVVYLIIRFTPIAEPQATGEQVTYERTPWAFRHLTLGVIAIFFYVGVEVGIPATLISYLTPKVGFAAAGFIAARYWILMLVGRTIGSAIGGKVSSRTMVICVASVAIALMVAAMLIGDSIMVKSIVQGEVIAVPLASTLLVLCGLCTSVMWTSIFNMATEGLGKYTAKASGIFMMMVVGGGVVPYIQSVVAGHNCLASYIVPVIGVAFILYYALWGSKNVNKDIKVD
ncbi:MAG: MFS transporter [Paludibacteraceae bacterium]|nr:MFS transporter [Paludibacteraceae bacterium]MBQ6984953.1 MFS transporter [Paludibacteraceae bacterium]MBR6035076.1 MFS transporter [Paludibacteraceae bacterium]